MDEYKIMGWSMGVLVVASFLILLVGLGGVIFRHTFTKIERSECLMWQLQSVQFDRFYATEWQQRQCAVYDIEL